MLPIILIAAAISALPHFDIDRICRGDGSDRAKAEYKTCTGSEQTALAALQQKWAQYPAKLRKECAHVARVAPESTYVELQTCIESQIGDAKTGAAPGK
ncbi:MAG TPA: hypothetical protein VKU03_08865 [Roseiarcus sp.]|nr:hypothetical protein [Roseiarcus sp.]